MDTTNDQYSIKKLLFSKAIPNYVIPIPTAGHKVYACTDCGDKFLLESSYTQHTNRKSMKISYFCRFCNSSKVFYNRCNLLCHIRFHAFKSATINVSDLKIEPLPLKFYNNRVINVANSVVQSAQESPPSTEGSQKVICYDCKATIKNDGDTVNKQRSKHFMQASNVTYSCVICLYSLSTPCGLKAHMRIHFKIPPYYCPECGMHLTQRSTNFPYDHRCEGFKMMKTTARLSCPAPECHLVHPSDFREHLASNHLKTVYKCPYCYVACFDEKLIAGHVKNHKEKENYLTFYQCEICPGKLIMPNQVESHFKSHITYNYVHPCWSCGKVFKDISSLLGHHIEAHDNIQEPIKEWLKNICMARKNSKEKKVYRVVKRCDQCKRSFSYKCSFEQIRMLPSECPYKCTPVPEQTSSENMIISCFVCKSKISQSWEEVKEHFKKFHKTHCCVDVKVVVPKLADIEKYLPAKNTFKKGVVKRIRPKRNRNKNVAGVVKVAAEKCKNTSEFSCKVCGQECENKEILEKHLISHKDPCMAYQCMECGQCFVVKPSFSKHLLLEHNISNYEEYIIEKRCYNENALMKYQDGNASSEPLQENQCKICRDQFENSDDLHKHFRVHGMAFLMKTKSSP